MYRCVKDNNSNEVLAIGMDEGQGNVAYDSVGVWQDFVFDTIPLIPEDVALWAAENDFKGSLLKVVDGAVVSKTLGDF